MLYACYDLIPLHTVMELSWRHGLTDFTMVSPLHIAATLPFAYMNQPFMINYMSQQASAIETLKKDNDERKAKEASQQKDDDNTPILGGSRLMLTQGPMQSAPSPSPYAQTNGVLPQATGYGGGFR